MSEVGVVLIVMDQYLKQSSLSCLTYNSHFNQGKWLWFSGGKLSNQFHAN